MQRPGGRGRAVGSPADLHDELGVVAHRVMARDERVDVHGLHVAARDSGLSTAQPRQPARSVFFFASGAEACKVRANFATIKAISKSGVMP